MDEENSNLKSSIKAAFTSFPSCIATYVGLAAFAWFLASKWF